MSRMKINDRFEEERGEVVELIPGGGRLPEGLTEGFQVRVVRHLAGDLRLVEREGREWVLPPQQLRFRRRVAGAARAVACETWNLPMRGIRPRAIDSWGVTVLHPAHRRPGH
jgi:hypothetical protein